MNEEGTAKSRATGIIVNFCYRFISCLHCGWSVDDRLILDLSLSFADVSIR